MKGVMNMFGYKKHSYLVLAFLFLSLLLIAGCSSERADSKGSNVVSANAAEAQQPEVQQTKIKVSGMTCSSCSFTVKAAIEKVDGVQKVTWESFDGRQGIVQVEFKKGTDVQKIRQAILDLGYKAE